MDEAENQINGMEHKETKNNQSKQEENRILKNEDIVRSFWDNFEHTNIHIMGVPERGEKSKKSEIYLKKQ